GGAGVPGRARGVGDPLHARLVRGTGRRAGPRPLRSLGGGVLVGPAPGRPRETLLDRARRVRGVVVVLRGCDRPGHLVGRLLVTTERQARGERAGERECRHTTDDGTTTSVPRLLAHVHDSLLTGTATLVSAPRSPDKPSPGYGQ